ncbi:MAG: DNA-3-methyladenine glycosylase [Pirellulaceae bacterium]|jgi:DNA-3-methyladenine glycosylase II|nr:DNA-3-methyladenine glycosylase [Pirellulaceae bacterium]MDP7017823.1 DNA-3-methyladenine glycosylase [Pirellulaceae bacterium]
MTISPETRRRASSHLRDVDPVLGAVVERVGSFSLVTQKGRFATLARSILSQQISTSAARTIRRRLETAMGGPPSADRILGLDDDDFRACGVSGQKTRYLRDLAERTASGEIRFRRHARLTDEQIIAELTAVKGIGRWTAQMFLIFSLGRPDVFAPDDLGLRSAIRALYGFDEMPSNAECLELAAVWAPFRSAASWYLWRSLE